MRKITIKLPHFFQPTLTVESLDPKESPRLVELLRGCAIVVSDIDYTIIDISKGHLAGIEAIAVVTNAQVAKRVDQIFSLIIEGHRRTATASWDQRSEFEEITTRMRHVQKTIVPSWGLKYWSKETMLLLAAEDVGFELNASSLSQARDAYWLTRTKNSTVYSYIPAFCQTLSDLGIVLDLFTSSYHIMQIAPDLSLSYEPEKSKQYKAKAILPYLPKMTKSICIGDPIDKPDAAFFQEVIKQIKSDLQLKSRQTFDFATVCVIGDSARNDLEFLGNLGCQTVLVTHR